MVGPPPPPAAARRASTTRRTSTVYIHVSFDPIPFHLSLPKLTRKRLLNIDHLPRARLHKPTPPLPRPLQPLRRLDHPRRRQITLIARNKLHGGDLPLVDSILLLHVDHLGEVLEALEAVLIRDVVDEEEGVGAEVRGCPERPVLFLARGVGEHEEVGLPVDGARYGVRVLC